MLMAHIGVDLDGVLYPFTECARIVVAERCIAEAVRRGKPAEAETWMTRHVQDFRRGYELAGMALGTRVAVPA